MLTATDIERALQEDEGQHIEFKQESETPIDIAEVLAAFANATGGHIIFGIAEDPIRIVGVHKIKQVRSNIVRAAQKIVVPPLPVDISTLPYEGNTLVIVSVAPGMDVYQCSGKFVARQHDQDLTIPPERLRALMVARGVLVFETQPVMEATVSDLDLDQVAGHIDRLARLPVRQIGGPSLSPLVQDPLDFLRARQALVDQAGTLVPTVFGLLMFGRHPQAFLPQAMITITIFDGLDSHQGYRDTVEVHGSLPTQIEAALHYLWGQIRHGGRFTGAAVREDVPEYPHAVLRELLVNAIAHRDYSITGSKVRLSVFTDRLELASPGALAGHITLENILQEQYSRNPKLVRLLLEAGYIEERGMGLDNVYYWLKEEKRPLPNLQDTGGSVIVTLPSPLAPASDAPKPSVRVAPPAPPIATHVLESAVVASTPPSVNPLQQAILGYLGQHGEVSVAALRAIDPNRKRRAFNYDIAQLVSWGLIERRGSTNDVTYRLRSQDSAAP